MSIKKLTFMAILALIITSCSEEEEPLFVPAVTGAIIDAEVGGEKQPNQVYIDLSTETTKVIAKDAYDLGFYSGSEFRVILNNATSALAYPLDKTDLNQVDETDSIGLSGRLDVDAIFGSLFGPPPSWLNEAASWMDDPSGDLNNTAIAAISANPEDNKVYILNRGNDANGNNLGWKKIRVIRSGNDYVLEHADINASSFESLTITKNSALAFMQIGFESGIVNASPAKEYWDIAFTTFTNLLPVGPTTAIPYSFKDYVISNTANVQIAIIEDESISYDEFSTNNLAGITFESDQNSIGSSWRTVAAPNSGNETGVVEGIFYILRDGQGNQYKLRFTRMLNPQTGERGFPQIQYDLIKN